MAIFDDRIERDEEVRRPQKILEGANKNANENEEKNVETEIIGKKPRLLMRDVSNFIKQIYRLIYYPKTPFDYSKGLVFVFNFFMTIACIGIPDRTI